jgi:hypothetical protein
MTSLQYPPGLWPRWVVINFPSSLPMLLINGSASTYPMISGPTFFALAIEWKRATYGTGVPRSLFLRSSSRSAGSCCTNCWVRVKKEEARCAGQAQVNFYAKFIKYFSIFRSNNLHMHEKLYQLITSQLRYWLWFKSIYTNEKNCSFSHQ